MAAQVLVKLGADLNRTRQQVVQLLRGSQGEDVTGEGPPLPDDAADAGRLAGRSARRDRRWRACGLTRMPGWRSRGWPGEGSRDRRQDFGRCRAARPGEATAGCRCWPGYGVGRGECWPHAAGPGIGPGEGRAGEAAGRFARHASRRVTTLHRRDGTAFAIGARLCGRTAPDLQFIADVRGVSSRPTRRTRQIAKKSASAGNGLPPAFPAGGRAGQVLSAARLVATRWRVPGRCRASWREFQIPAE